MKDYYEKELQVAETVHRYVIDGVARELDNIADRIAVKRVYSVEESEIIRAELNRLADTVERAVKGLKEARERLNIATEREKHGGFMVGDTVKAKDGKKYTISGFKGDMAELHGEEHDDVVKLKDIERSFDF